MKNETSNGNSLAAAWIRSHRWAITPDWLTTITQIASRDISAEMALAAQSGALRNDRQPLTVTAGVATISLRGPLVRYGGMFSNVSGATSVEGFSTEFHQALADPAVQAILLDINSPGGEVTGISEAAQMVYTARQRKPVIAYAGGLMASGAYWIGSAAHQVIADPTARLGSVGVVASWLDNDEGLARQGIHRRTVVSSQSPLKSVDWRTDTDAARTLVQRELDALAEVFIASVAKQRSVSREQVMQNFGRGGVLVGKAAVKAGLADRIGYLPDAFAAAVSAIRQPESITSASGQPSASGQRQPSAVTGQRQPSGTGRRAVSAGAREILEQTPQGRVALEMDAEQRRLLTGCEELSDVMLQSALGRQALRMRQHGCR